ncbi:lipocalin family protein [Pedobacter nyackensis]|uniref:lipocalin family protein n=1 Tax=Pedobacter nyackensis TaxID=475255 RepID=UPI00292E7EC7|nr:lipocalin family protein [Pedobacter nyackensis]
MKKQITFAITALFILTGLVSCQKDDGNQVVKGLAGQWKVSKIETTVAGAATVTYTGIDTDYFEFRRNEEDELYISLNTNSYTGNYVALEGKLLNFTYNGKLRKAKITTLTDNNFEFSATVEGETVATTEKYYLTR